MDDRMYGSMAEFIVKLDLALTARDYPVYKTIPILGYFVSYQFNGTRNDTAQTFENITKKLKEELHG